MVLDGIPSFIGIFKNKLRFYCLSAHFQDIAFFPDALIDGGANRDLLIGNEFIATSPINKNDLPVVGLTISAIAKIAAFRQSCDHLLFVSFLTVRSI